MNKITIHTDGACSGNPGRGAWAAIVEFPDKIVRFAKSFRYTTNNRMELMAVIEPIEGIKKPSEITVFCDSKYVVSNIELGWLKKWIENNWKKGDNKAVKNKDLWERMNILLDKHSITMKWIKGHNNNWGNEKADQLATEQKRGKFASIDMIYEEEEKVRKQLKKAQGALS